MIRNRSSVSWRRRIVNGPTSQSFVNAAASTGMVCRLRRVQSLACLNRKAMATQRLSNGAVRSMLWRVWNSSRKNRFCDYNPRCEMEIDSRSMHARPIGRKWPRHFADWISRSNWRVVMPKNRLRSGWLATLRLRSPIGCGSVLRPF